MTAALFLQKFPQLEKSKKKLKNLHPWKTTEIMGEMFQIFFGLNKQFLNNQLSKAVLNSAELQSVFTLQIQLFFS